MKLRQFKLIIPVLVVCLAGCTRHLADTAMAGTYEVSGDWGKSTLVLKPDGTFEQLVSLRKVDVKNIKGKWRMLDTNPKSYQRTIAFAPFIYMGTTTGIMARGTIVENAACAVESVGIRGVWIVVDNDYYTTYKKQ